MNIAIATDWFPPRRGGIESQLQSLAERLSSRGHRVTVITSTPGPSTSSAGAVRRIESLRLPGTQVAASPLLMRGVGRILDESFDVVHAHVSVVSPLGYAALAAARRRGLPVVATFHSVLRFKRALLSLVNAVTRLDRGPVVWSAVSEKVAAQVRRALPGAGVSVLPNGVDLAFWATGAREPDPMRHRVTLVTAMRLHPKKRPLELVHAFRRAAAATGIPARLVIAGDGPLLGALRRQAAELPLSGTALEVPGWQDAERLRSLYAEADAFVLPTVREAFGIAALEARAAGLPVIAMSAAGCSEFLRDGANALVCADDAGLAEAIGRVLRDATLRRQLASARPDLSRYDWGAVIDAHERAYANAMARALPGSAART